MKFILFWLGFQAKNCNYPIRYVRNAIGDLAFSSRFSREHDKIVRRGCIEHDLYEGDTIWTNMDNVGGDWINRAQFRSRREER
jgi:hypothetical protein